MTEDEYRKRAAELRRQALELVDRRAAELGVERPELVRRLRLARNENPRFGEVVLFLGHDDWQEWLSSALEERAVLHAEKDRQRVATSVGDVLCAALRLTSAQRLAKMTPELRQFATSYDGERGALIAGPTGIGKTLCCVELIDRLVREDQHEAREVFGQTGRHPSLKWSIRAVSASEVGRCVEYGQARMTASTMLHVDDMRLVIIDDLGWEPEAGAPAIRALLAQRYEQGLATIITSGWTIDALRKRYGDALLRRALETRGEQGVVLDLHKDEDSP